MTVVSHEREPGELGYVARYGKLVNELVDAGPGATRPRSGPSSVSDLGWAIVEAEMLRLPRLPAALRPARRHLPRARGLGRQAPDDVGRAGRRPRRALASAAIGHGGGDDTWLKVYLYSRAQSVMGGTSQIQRNLVARRILELPDLMSTYDLPRRAAGRSATVRSASSR